jgi:hypothetical protein
MKQPFTHIISLTLALLFYQAGIAQTYAIHSNKNFTALSPSASWCTGCIFNIDPGVTLTLNSSVGCTNCIFNGGILLESAGFAFTGGTINVDTMSITSTTNFYPGSSGGLSFTNGKLEVKVATTCQACSFSNETVHIDQPTGGSFTLQASGSYTTSTITGSTFTVNAGQFYANIAATISGSTLTINNSSTVKADDGQFSLSNSTLFMNGSSAFSMSSGPLALSNNSEIIIGDGSGGSTASLFFNGGSGTTGVNIHDNSLIKVANGKNSYQNNAAYTYTSSTGATSSYATQSNTISCNHGAVTGNANNCTSNYVYGCATMNGSGALACTVLATASLDLTAQLEGTGTVTLSWSDAGNGNTDHFQVQRSSNGSDWSTLGTVTGNGYAAGEYHYNDPAAPAGTDYYRIAQTDKNGQLQYSTVSTVTIAPSTGAVSIYPNPITGHIFFIRSASTEELVLNIFTLTGQLLFHTSLKGQTQYPIHLPSSAAANSAIVVQVIGNTHTQAFTLLNQ